jgi:hypothetical protein
LDRKLRLASSLVAGHGGEPNSASIDVWTQLSGRTHVDDWSAASAAARDSGALQALMTQLEFIEQLDKHIYHSYEGCVALDFGSAPGAALFFVANRKTCRDWFARTRGALLAASLAAGAAAEAAHHGSRRLRDVQTSLGGSLTRIVASLVAMQAVPRARAQQLLGAVLLQVYRKPKNANYAR